MMKQYTIALIILLSIAAPAACPARAANAAALYVSPPSGSYHKGENFEVRVMVNSDVAINAVSGVLSFPTQYIRVVDITKKNSILNFWVEEPSFSNTGASGNVRLEGVILNPGFKGSQGNILTITFRAENEGAAGISFTQSAVLANDGRGTNVNASIAGTQVTVLPQRAVPVGAQNSQASSEKPQVIVIKQLQQQEPPILSFWKASPKWVQMSILIFVGLAAIMSSLIILSFGAVVLVWFWSHIWHRRLQFFAFFRLLTHIPKDVVLKTAHSLGMAARELKGDVRYSVQRSAEEFRFKEAPRIPSFRMLVKEYLFVISDIVKRFFTKNSKKNQDEDTSDLAL